MSLEIKIPAVGESITSGLLSVWHKNDGDAVAADEALFTLETDKVSTEIVAEKAGTLKITAPAGSEVKIGEIVGTIEEGGAVAKSAPVSSAQTHDDKSDARTTHGSVEPPAREQPKTPAVTIPAGVARENFEAPAAPRLSAPSPRRTSPFPPSPKTPRPSPRAAARGKKCRRCAARSRSSSSWRSTPRPSSPPSTNAT